MKHLRLFSPALLAVLVAIGCTSSKPQDASAEADKQAAPAAEQPAAPATSAPGAQGSGSVTGAVKFEGTAPAATKVKMNADPICQQQHTEPVMSEEVVVNSNNTLKNVFVYVKEGVSGSYSAPTEPVVLAQKGCWYLPHVFGIQVGQPLQIVNDDATLHNVNSKSKGKTNKPFNIAQPTKDMKTEKKFSEVEVLVPFKCNVHPWMHAFAGVVNNPFYAVTDDSGNFTIKGLPAGTYTIEAVHEKYGPQTQQVTIGDGESKAAEFTFKAE